MGPPPLKKEKKRMNIHTFQCKTKWHWSQVRRCGIFVVICEWFRPVENHKGGVSVNQEHSFKAKNAVKSFLPFLFNDITWKTSLLKTKKWRKMIMCHLTQKGVFFLDSSWFYKVKPKQIERSQVKISNVFLRWYVGRSQRRWVSSLWKLS